jgi:hypothetical protein
MLSGFNAMGMKTSLSDGQDSKNPISFIYVIKKFIFIIFSLHLRNNAFFGVQPVRSLDFTGFLVSDQDGLACPELIGVCPGQSCTLLR